MTDNLTPDETQELERLEARLSARTTTDGSARAGYKNNVAHIQARIAQLHKKRGDSFVAFVQ